MEQKKSLLENIIYLRDLNETWKHYNLNKELTDAIDDVCTYADDCYVGHCEEIGKIAIEDIERMKEEWMERSLSFLRRKWFWPNDTDVDIDDYKRFMNHGTEFEN